MTKLDLANLDLNKLQPAERDKLLKLMRSMRLDPTFLDFVPHDAQGAFFCSDSNETLFIAGNQSGKSEAGVIQSLYWATGEYPVWYPEHRKIPVPNRGRICGPDLKNWVSEILEPKIKRWLPESYIKSLIKNPQTKSLDQIVLTNGSVIDVLSYQQEQISFESWTGNWIWCDEPPKRDQYIALIRGLAALNGRAIMTLTPLTEPWIYQLVDACKTVFAFGKASYSVGQRVIDTTATTIRVVTCTTDDNLKQANWLGIEAGGMSLEGLKFFLSTLSPEEEQVRRFGKFVHLQGLVYKTFTENTHVIDDASIPGKGTMYQVLDPHDAKPHAVSWFRVDAMGTVYCVHCEAIEGNLNDLANKIKDIEQANGWTVEVRVIDPNKGKTPTSVSRCTWQEELADRGLWMETSINDDITLGHQVVKSLLAWDNSKPVDEINHPKIYFAREGARNMIFSLKNYVHDLNINTDKNSKFKDKPRDKWKDFPDTLRYGAMYPFQYFSVVPDPEFYHASNWQTSSHNRVRKYGN